MPVGMTSLGFKFRVYDWYWSVGDHPNSGVFSSAKMLYVPIDNPDYILWLAANAQASTIANEAELWEVLQHSPTPPAAWLFDGDTFSQPSAGLYTKVQLLAYTANARYLKTIGGVVVNGLQVATDDGTQAKLIGAFNLVTANPNITINWKLPSGFITLNAAQITAIANAVGLFVQACFAAENVLDDQIKTDTVTTLAQIDAAFAAVT